MAACSVASHVVQNETGVSTNDTKQQDSIAEVAIKHVDTVSQSVKQQQDSTIKRQDVKTITQDTTFIADSSHIVADSIHPSINPQDTTAQDSVPAPMFKDIVSYTADDSIKLSIPNKEMFLYKNGFIKYLTTELTADSISLNMGTNEAYASGVSDTAGTLQGKPVFKEGAQEFECLDLKYNFKTGKAYVKEIITQQGEGYIQGKLTKRMSDSIYCVKNGWYTTCDQHDHPHFYIRMSKAKLIKDKKVVSGFANLYI